MPVLYLAIGRRLGYPLYLVETYSHFFVRWQSPDGKDRFNFEGTHGVGVHDDAYLANWPKKLNKEELKYYLKNLTSAEELSIFLQIRGDCLEALGRHPEASVAFARAHQLMPKSPFPVQRLAHSLCFPTKGLAPSVFWDGPHPN